MITAINHVAFAADDAAGAAADYELVFGRQALKLTSDEGRSAYRFQLDNIAFEIGEAEGGAAGLRGIAFEVEDMAATARKLERRGLGVEPRLSERWTDGRRTIARNIARLSLATTHGVAMSLVETTQSASEMAAAAPTSAVTAIDHLVVRSRNPERAIALYGGRLGLDFALDRTNPDWGARLLFFRCGGVRVEIGHTLGKGVSDDPDVLSGLAWRVGDAAEAQRRLTASGVQTSDAKQGRRPGSHVLTVRSNTCNVPTLFLSETPRDEAAA